MDSEDSDQTGRMPRLICVFAGRTCHFVGFVMRRLISNDSLVISMSCDLLYFVDELEKDNAVKYQEISDTEESKQFSEQFDSATVSEANISEEEFSIFEGGELEELYSADEVVDADLDIKPQGLIEGNVDIMEPYPISVRGASTASVAVKEVNFAVFVYMQLWFKQDCKVVKFWTW